jgi:LPXTG-motif cell wall-anchored protein
LENGVHNVTLYAADLAGNTADPNTLFFSVDVPEPFPVVPVTTAFASVAIVLVSAGLLLYFKKRKH